MRDDTHFGLTVNMLCNNEVCCGEEDNKGIELCVTRGQLTTQETEVKIQNESEDIRALRTRDLRKKVDE